MQTVTRYIDTHIHLDLLNDVGVQLEAARAAGVGAWVVPGVSCDRWDALLAIAEAHKGVYIAPGVHPQAAEACLGPQLDQLRLLLAHSGAVAIGEVGLDRQVEVSWQTQEEVFVRMVRLALETEKPLLIHARQSTDRVLAILRREQGERVGGIFHAFSGSPETAREVVDMGFALGVGGVITFAAARRLPEVVRGVPAGSLVLETDAPYMTPEPYRGQANRPQYLLLAAERLAALRGWSLEETKQITTDNARRVLNLPPEIDVSSVEGVQHE